MVRWKFRVMILGYFVAFLIPVARGQGVDVSMKVVIRHGPNSGNTKMTMGIPDVVVWLSPLQPLSSMQLSSTHGPYRLVQRNKEFEPHLLVVPTGSNVEFPNTDPFFHNVFSLFNGKRFDLGLYESGTSRSVRFDREGVSYIFCNIHPEMGAVVLTLSTPFYAIARKNGDAVIHGVPPGSYRLQIWSEQAKPVNSANLPRDVQISATETNLGEIELETTPSSLAGHKNKFGEEYHPAPNSPY
jgi:plastocyanin